MKKYGRCDCCGDMTEVITYNDNESCKHCLSLNKQGKPQEEIIERILYLYDKRNRLSNNRKRDR